MIGKPLIIPLIPQTEVTVTFSKLKEDMRGICYNDLDELDFAVAATVGVLEIFYLLIKSQFAVRMRILVMI
jgi:hypothetical protein